MMKDISKVNEKKLKTKKIRDEIFLIGCYLPAVSKRNKIDERQTGRGEGDESGLVLLVNF